jgi:hypothetical protein
MFQRCFIVLLAVAAMSQGHLTAQARQSGEGGSVGKLALATKLKLSKDGKTVELENYDTAVDRPQRSPP